MADIACWDLAIIFVENRREGACLLMVTTAYCSTCYLFYGLNKSKGNKTSMTKYISFCVYFLSRIRTSYIGLPALPGGGGSSALEELKSLRSPLRCCYFVFFTRLFPLGDQVVYKKSIIIHLIEKYGVLTS